MITNTNYLKQLVSYIKKNLSKGYTIEALKWALVNQGYSRGSVEKAIDITNRELAASAPKLVEKPVIRYEAVDEEKPEKKGFWQRIADFFKG
ncbi:hypothetical protein HYT26_04215 [Candidatus Pacearchaeota archaeon]|nr:hypothetical protein [Candidatus Pacearchaeota archaeon]